MPLYRRARMADMIVKGGGHVDDDNEGDSGDVDNGDVDDDVDKGGGG